MDANELEKLNQWVSRLTVEEIKNLPESQLTRIVLQRPGHPDQFGWEEPLVRMRPDR